MSKTDWYCNKVWSDEIEARFFQKLSRARFHRDHYLAVQASMLAQSHPDVALRLLDLQRVHDGAPLIRADIFLARGRVSEALACYRRVLEDEAATGILQNSTHLSYALIVAENQVASEFADANACLDRCEKQLVWPLEQFEWNAAKALLLGSANHARLALEHAKVKRSPFRFHQELGLVGKEQKPLIRKLFKVLKSPATEQDIDAKLVFWSDQVRLAPPVVPPSELKRRRRQVELQKESQPIREALKKVGLVVEKLADLENEVYSADIYVPILLEHIKQDYSIFVRRRILSILRSLSPDVATSGILLDCFIAEPNDSAYKKELGYFLGEKAHSASAKRIAAIISDPNQGESRMPLSYCITKYLDNEIALGILRPLLHPDHIPWKPIGDNPPSPAVGCVIEALGDARITEARDDIVPWTQHKDSYTRTKAKRAIGKIDTAIRRKQKKQK